MLTTLLLALALNIPQQPQVSVFPVPFNSSLSLKVDGNHPPLKVKVYSLTGNEILSTNLSANTAIIQLETNSWKPGNYIVQLFDHSGHNIKTLKAIKR